ncbi:O-antigen ligase family protein [Bacillus sp. REN16]|uniref:O-antigen ligase family protein n=1 Tax=Bacillus sp. REN16 TaxID=2887296 RepID=UPI001E37177F|nr:O-antigen ligase family protein [Bacillus sp. REN16]MCC3356086.1 O-antigen ligase family protein [Bacillus sp. REN16]
MKTFLVSTIILAIYVLINELMNGFNQYTRIGSLLFGNQYTMFTYYLMISLCIATWLFFKEIRKTLKVILLFIIVFLYFISVFTAIRKAIIIPIIFWIGYVFMISVNRKKVISGFLKITMGICMVIIAYPILMNNEYFASTVGRRMQGFIAGLQGTGEADNSFNERQILVKAALECFKSYPFFGYGFGAFRDFADKTVGIRLYAHNNYLELLASTGSIGFSIYYGGLLLILRKLFKRFKEFKDPLFALGFIFIISLLINDFAVVSYLSLPYMVLISVISCLCVINLKNIRKL